MCALVVCALTPSSRRLSPLWAAKSSRVPLYAHVCLYVRVCMYVCMYALCIFPFNGHNGCRRPLTARKCSHKEFTRLFRFYFRFSPQLDISTGLWETDGFDYCYLLAKSSSDL
uniref:Secreted protein n=1 Tax=Haemonchus contortus TaxID=6289 RepID=A0A7I4XRX9_HAECO